MDKVQQIKAEIEKILNEGLMKLKEQGLPPKGEQMTLKKLLSFIDSLPDVSETDFGKKEEPKFKVGDKVTNGKVTGEIIKINEENYYSYKTGYGDWVRYHGLPFKDQDQWELVEESKPKFKAGQTIRHKETGDVLYIDYVDDEGYHENSSYSYAPICEQDKWKLVEEPVSKIWHDSNKEQPEFGATVVIWNGSDGEIATSIVSVNSDRIWAYIDDLLDKKEEPVSEDLKKFAEEWDESLYRSDAVIAGAKWHKQQIMKEAVEAQYHGNVMFQGQTFVLWDYKDLPLEAGDKVKLIIVNEDLV